MNWIEQLRMRLANFLQRAVTIPIFPRLTRLLRAHVDTSMSSSLLANLKTNPLLANASISVDIPREYHPAADQRLVSLMSLLRDASACTIEIALQLTDLLKTCDSREHMTMSSANVDTEMVQCLKDGIPLSISIKYI